MFGPTLYFVDATGGPHDTGQARVSHWCYGRDAGGWGPPATADQAGAFRAGMAKCFKHAVARGMSLAVAPHVDDGTGSGEVCGCFGGCCLFFWRRRRWLLRLWLQHRRGRRRQRRRRWLRLSQGQHEQQKLYERGT